MSVQILVGNSLEVLPTLQPDSVHCSVTSPPYYGLRKYQGDQQCDWPEVGYSPMPGLPTIAVEPMICALGHEPTIEAYVGHLVAIYREVWRVLRDDGVAWIVMGDSYAGSWGNYAPGGIKGTQRPKTEEGKRWDRPSYDDTTWRPPASYYPQGNLMLVPHRLALALQGDRWLVRNDDVWAKVAPMPESVSGWRWERHRVKVKKSDRATNPFQKGAGTRQGAGVASRAQREAYYEQGKGASKWIDCPGCPKCEPNGGYVLKRGSWRHTRAHEFVFMLAKGMQYWTNQEAVREALADYERQGGTATWECDGATTHGVGSETLHQMSSNGRNPRSVLSPSPEPFPGPHFAVFPTGLIEPLIKATCPDRCCPECGAGWSPVVEKRKADETNPRPFSKPGNEGDRNDVGRIYEEMDNNVIGYRPTCGCGHDDHIPGICLDPFFGTGTTGLVCDRLGLDCIGIDTSRAYAVDIARERIVGDAPLFADVQVQSIALPS